ncbi:MAG: glycosyltransferase family 4 protein [Chroococcidiopsidaceae cyanobacterium CP_BM_ER_R8_30]|nr:glycosyltransferase family 4 protein [Chroococcidiopsidaceae cyanobacterium CP_BM_ER_R8_30]
MSLKGINVLVDGYNLELPTGTGIKTYSKSLVQALNLLEADVNILFSRSGSNSNDSILNEVLLFDNPNNRKLSKIDLIRTLAKTSIGLFNQPTKIKAGRQVLQTEFSDELLSSSEILNLSSCYLSANTLYKFFGKQIKITTPYQIDIWHSTCPLPIKIRRAKKITTIHDLIPLRLPYTTLDDKKAFYTLVKDSIKDSSIIITVSENSKRDILNIFDITSDKVHVTYQPVLLKPLLEEERVKAFLKKYEIKFKKYILFVGAIEPKKNLGRLIDAYAELDTDMQLIIVGKKGWLWKGEIGKLNSTFDKRFAAKVKFLEYVSNNDLGYFYQGALCLVFPSLYEGFGLPPLEAMSFNCPVITSNAASLPEVCGDAALYVNPYDVTDIKEKIEKMINDPQVGAKLSEAGRERVKLFSMDNYIKKLSDAYNVVL